MNTDQTLSDILNRLKAGQANEDIWQEVRELLASASPQDLPHIEAQLREAGLEPQDLRHLCSAHLELFAGAVDRLRQRVPAGHMLDTLVAEHEMILGFLDELEAANRTIQAMDRFDPQRDEFDTLRHLAEHLVETEKHHQREEDVLFPEVEAHGLTGPSDVMRLEHEEMRPINRELRELADSAESIDFDWFKNRLNAMTEALVPTLREHIAKENNVLYPAALEAIDSPERWEQMRQRCDQIGYCCFTPASGRV